jgi:hypothetical protein
MTADNAYCNLDTTIHSQHGAVLNESHMQSQGHLRAAIHVYLFLSNLITSPSLNPIILLVILHGKLCRAVLA